MKRSHSAYNGSKQDTKLYNGKDCSQAYTIKAIAASEGEILLFPLNDVLVHCRLPPHFLAQENNTVIRSTHQLGPLHPKSNALSYLGCRVKTEKKRRGARREE